MWRSVFCVTVAVAGVVLLPGCGPAGDGPELTRLRNQAKAHFENGETAEAIAIFQDVLASPGATPEDEVNLGKAYFLAGDHDHAISILERARESLPTLPDIPYNLGIMHKRDGRIDDAIAELERFHELDPGSVPGTFNVGVLYARAGRNADALLAFDRILAADPFNAAAHYQRFTVLRALGRRDEAQLAFDRFAELKDRIPAERLESVALEESPYFEIAYREPGDAEPARIEPIMPPYTLGLSATPGSVPPFDGATALAAGDVDGDGDADVVVVHRAAAGAAVATVVRNDGDGRWLVALDLTAPAGDAHGLRLVDLDNDTDLDVLVVSARGAKLHRNDGQGARLSFSDQTDASRLANATGTAVSLADYDHDGDLDVHVSGHADALSRLYRNGGTPDPATPPVFVDVTAEAYLPNQGTAGPVYRDLDGDFDTDLVALNASGRARAHRNAGQQEFRAAPSEVTPSSPARALACDDVTGDGWADVVLATDAGLEVFANAGEVTFTAAGTFALGGAPPDDATAPAILAMELVDLDADGDLDAVLTRAGGTVVAMRNDGRGSFEDVTETWGVTGLSLVPTLAAPAVSDLDGDGTLDLVGVDPEGGFVVSRGAGGGANVWLTLEGGKSNARGVGSVVDVQSGRLFTRRTVTDTPMPIGVGTHTTLDFVRVQWPSWIIQNEIDVDLTAERRIHVKEKPAALGSCPSLYAWDGDAYVFVTDVLATTSLGLALDGETPMPFDDEELIRIPTDLAAVTDGELQFVITEELNEIVYLDQVRLLVVDHPPSVRVYSNTILRDEPFPPAGIVAVRRERPPFAATDHTGADCLTAIGAVDGFYAAPFENVGRQYHGLADMHAIDLELGPATDRSTLVMILHGWIDWPETATFLSIAQNPDLELVLPTVHAKGAIGWRQVHAPFAVQALKPKDVVLDLRGRLNPDETVLRIESNLACYWDRIALADAVDAERETAVVIVDPSRAELSFHGWSARRPRDASPLTTYDYHRVDLKAPWAGSTGRFTRYGDVLPLVTLRDDIYAILNTGDEVRFAVSATGLPEEHAGWVRDYFVWLAGFEKQADYGTLASGTVEPLPFREMDTYPYGPGQAYPDGDAHRQYLETFNTRLVERAASPPR